VSYLSILITFIFIDNVILSKLLGLCPFIGVSKKNNTAIRMGIAVVFVMGMSSLLTWAVYNLILLPLGLDYLRIVAFILVITVFVQLVEMLIAKIAPPLYMSAGIHLPLIATNCAVLGVCLISIENRYNMVESFTAGCAGGIGFMIVLILISAIREKLETEWVPKPFRGMPIAFITAGLMSLAFMAFDKVMLHNIIR
jgi:electron transport complex protein RnfA